MPRTLPLSALRNYTDVFRELQKSGTSIQFTNHGQDAGGTLVNTKEWQKTQAEVRLLTELNGTEKNFGDGISLQDFRARHLHG